MHTLHSHIPLLYIYIVDSNSYILTHSLAHTQSTLFPPTTPPLILSMCSSSILKEIRRLKDNYHFTPMAMEKYLVWKEGAKPTPNKSYPLNQFMQNYVLYHDNTPLPVMQKESVEGGGAEGGAKKVYYYYSHYETIFCFL